MLRRSALASVVAASTLALSAFAFIPGAHATVGSHAINGRDITFTTPHWVGTTTGTAFSCVITSPYTNNSYYSGPDNTGFDRNGVLHVPGAGPNWELDTPTEGIAACTAQTSEHPSHNLIVTGTTGCDTNYGDSSFQYTTENTGGLLTLRCYAYAPLLLP